MYVRQPDNQRRQVKIPENYSGHAFREPSLYSDMPPPTRLDVPLAERRENDRRADERLGNEQFTSHAYGREPAPQQAVEKTVSEGTGEFTEKLEAEELSADSDNEARQEARPSSLLSSLLPSSILGGSNFPFGHGIGSEEILILAIMLLVYLSGEDKGKTDTEFLLMLGLLLFAG